MFDWLADEISSCGTRKFHRIDGQLPNDVRMAMEEANLPIPPSYKNFILRFGNADFYRKGSIYLVRIFAAPRSEIFKEEEFFQFGRTDSALAYFKASLLVEGCESPVFEWRQAQGMRKAADGFEEWLKKKCQAAQKRFNKKEWEAIKSGPPAFGNFERAIIEARRAFQWRIVGIAKNGDTLFEIHNGSAIILPYFSIGVRKKDGEAFGRIWLPVSSILPGETKTVGMDCYKRSHSAQELEFFELPDPYPEDRDLYWEFRGQDSFFRRQ